MFKFKLLTFSEPIRLYKKKSNFYRLTHFKHSHTFVFCIYCNESTEMAAWSFQIKALDLESYGIVLKLQ